MTEKLQNNRGTNIGLWIIIGLILLLGTFFRFNNIDRKIYWVDEVNTSLWISGYTWADFIDQLSDRVIGIEDLRKFQSVNSDRGLLTTIKVLSIEDTQHPPLYYGLVRLWAGFFGDSVWAIRLLSVLISLLAFPFLYWLCRELFESKWVACMAIIILAVSPVNVLLSQEARQYSLWTVTILFSSASLLAALRCNSKIFWTLYGISIVMGMYTHTLFIFVVVSHALYVPLSRLNQTSIRPFFIPREVLIYFIVTIAGLVTFLPWAYLIYTNFSRVRANLSWLNYSDSSRIYLIGQWGFNFSSIFFDTGYAYRYVDKFDLPVILSYASRVAVLILIAESVYFLYSSTSKRIWVFVFLLIFIPFLTLALMDTFLGGSRSGNGYKYLLPSYLGVQIAVAYLLTMKIDDSFHKKRYLWQAILALITVGGLISCIISSKAESWWNKGDIEDYNIPRICQIINQTERPLMIAELNMNMASRLVSFSHKLKSDVDLLLIKKDDDFSIPQGYTDIFVYKPSPELEKEIGNNYRHRLKVVTNDVLWIKSPNQ